MLNKAGKRQQDLPTLPRFFYANGQPFLCRNSMLGRCMYRKCRYLREGRHPSPNDIPDNFADKVIGVFSAGIQACMQTGVGDEAPGKKIKLKSINLT